MATEAKSVNELELKKQEEAARVANEKRTGKGTRIRVGQTRGRNPKVITWEAFDTDKADTLPETAKEFAEIVKTLNNGKELDNLTFVSYLVDGFNAAQYAAASDILSEYVEANWPADLVKSFKQAINGFVASAGISVEDAVSLMKPKIQAAFEAKLKAAQEAKS